jgi:hypothetical protein
MSTNSMKLHNSVLREAKDFEDEVSMTTRPQKIGEVPKESSVKELACRWSLAGSMAQEMRHEICETLEQMDVEERRSQDMAKCLSKLLSVFCLDTVERTAEHGEFAKPTPPDSKEKNSVRHLLPYSELAGSMRDLAGRYGGSASSGTSARGEGRTSTAIEDYVGVFNSLILRPEARQQRGLSQQVYSLAGSAPSQIAKSGREGYN